MIMKKYIVFSIIALSMGLTSCNDWLDKLPDNRMEPRLWMMSKAC